MHIANAGLLASRGTESLHALGEALNVLLLVAVGITHVEIFRILLRRLRLSRNQDEASWRHDRQLV